LSRRYLSVGMAARMRVSSEILRLASRGTFRSARTFHVVVERGRGEERGGGERAGGG
jgi:hypothetical protein